MARVTIEDCKKIIPNHFELVVLASRRGRDIASGSPVLVEKSNDKNAVVALREIGAKKLNVELLRDSLLQSFRKNSHVDSMDDNKKEDYLELDDMSESQFSHAFDQEFIEESVAIEEDSFDAEEMSFEDENIDIED